MIGDSADAIVRITTSAICGTDLHFVRGTMPGMRPGTILGHEAVGVVEETGPQAPNFNPVTGWSSPRPSAAAAACTARPATTRNATTLTNGQEAGTAFYGGPESAGPFDDERRTTAAVRAGGDILVLETLFFADEVRDPHRQIQDLPGRVKLSRQELSMARQLIDAMSWRDRLAGAPRLDDLPAWRQPLGPGGRQPLQRTPRAVTGQPLPVSPPPWRRAPAARAAPHCDARDRQDRHPGPADRAG